MEHEKKNVRISMNKDNFAMGWTECACSARNKLLHVLLVWTVDKLLQNLDSQQFILWVMCWCSLELMLRTFEDIQMTLRSLAKSLFLYSHHFQNYLFKMIHLGWQSLPWLWIFSHRPLCLSAETESCSQSLQLPSAGSDFSHDSPKCVCQQSTSAGGETRVSVR